MTWSFSPGPVAVGTYGGYRPSARLNQAGQRKCGCGGSAWRHPARAVGTARVGICEGGPVPFLPFCTFRQPLLDHPSRSWDVYCSPMVSKAPMILRKITHGET